MKKSCFSLFFILIFFTVYSKNINSKNITDDLLRFYINKNDISHIEQLIPQYYFIDMEKLLDISKRYLIPSKNQTISLDGYLYEAEYYYRKNNYGLAEKKLIASLIKLNQYKSEIDANQYQSMNYRIRNKLYFLNRKLGKYNEGIKYITIYLNNSSPIKHYDLLGLAKIDLEQYQQGIAYILKQAEIDIKQKQKFNLSIRYNTIGDAYVKWFLKIQNRNLLNNAQAYYNKAYRVMKNEEQKENYSYALLQMRLANISYLKGEYNVANNYYAQCVKDTTFLAEPTSMQVYYIGTADCYTKLNQPKLALANLEKVISLYKTNTLSEENRIKTYHLLANNYKQTHDNEKALKYSQLNLIETERFINNKLQATGLLHDFDIKKIKQEAEFQISEMKKNEEKLLCFFIFLILSLVFVIILVYVKQRRIKQKIQQQVYKIISKQQSYAPKEEKKELKINNNKEQEIINKLKKLEESQYFLNEKFNQSHIAKKIGTNTAYLSNVVNNYFGKTFSEYMLDLRIGYVVKKLVENKIYREYTIQAITESVGYKSPQAFSKSFKIKMGVTPYQFINEIKKKNR